MDTWHSSLLGFRVQVAMRNNVVVQGLGRLGGNVASVPDSRLVL